MEHHIHAVFYWNESRKELPSGLIGVV